MNWKKEATHKLETLKLMRNSLQTLPTEIQRLETDLQTLSSPDMAGVHVLDCDSGKREDQIFNNMLKRQMLQQLLQQTKRWVWFAEQGLKALDSQERLLLETMYVDRPDKPVEFLCSQLLVERSTLYRRVELALRRFTIALYSAMETD